MLTILKMYKYKINQGSAQLHCCLCDCGYEDHARLYLIEIQWRPCTYKSTRHWYFKVVFDGQYCWLSLQDTDLVTSFDVVFHAVACMWVIQKFEMLTFLQIIFKCCQSLKETKLSCNFAQHSYKQQCVHSPMVVAYSLRYKHKIFTIKLFTQENVLVVSLKH